MAASVKARLADLTRRQGEVAGGEAFDRTWATGGQWGANE